MVTPGHSGGGSDEPATTDGGHALDRDKFDRLVASELAERGHGEIASWTRGNANNSRAIGPADVADELGLERAERNVDDVADAVQEAYHDQQESLRNLELPAEGDGR